MPTFTNLVANGRVAPKPGIGMPAIADDRPVQRPNIIPVLDSSGRVETTLSSCTIGSGTSSQLIEQVHIESSAAGC
jgi:hypothetical protein